MRLDTIYRKKKYSLIFPGKKYGAIVPFSFLYVNQVENLNFVLKPISKKICGFEFTVNDPKLLKELKQRKIKINDSECKESDIENKNHEKMIKCTTKNRLLCNYQNLFWEQ